MRGDLVALDLESTGLDIQQDFIIEIGAVKIRDGVVIAEYGTLIDPGLVIPAETTRITGIHAEDLRGAPSLKTVLPQLETFIGDAPVIAHGAAFDVGFMRRFNLLQANLILDTLDIASILLPRVARYNLSMLASHMGVDLENAHRALDDARATALLYWQLWQKALTVPQPILSEICAAAQPLNWEMLPFFAAALNEQPPQNNTPFNINVFPPLTEETPPLRPNETLLPIDVDYITAVVDDSGALAQAIPAYEQRPQQVDMARAIAEAFNDRKHLMVEAGTGTGKSIAYLVPALHWATRNNARVVISTNTMNLQDQLMHKDVPQVEAALQDHARVAVMKGRDNYLCPRRLAAVRRRHPSNTEELKTMAKILLWLLESQTGDRSEINLRFSENFIWNRLSARDEGCTMHRCSTVMAGTCPFYKARRQAESAHVVIANHALIVADALSENRVLPDYQYLVVDEAHTLEDAITNGLSVRIEMPTLLRRISELGGVNSGVLGDMLRNARTSVPEKTILRLEAFIEDTSEAIKAMQAQIRAFFGKVFDFLKDAASEETYALRLDGKLRRYNHFAAVQATWQQLDEYFEVVSDALEQLTNALSKLEKHEIPDYNDHISSTTAAATYLRDIRATLNAFSVEPDSNTVYWVSAGETPENISIQTAPLHVGPMMEQTIWQAKDSAILTSATLQTAGTFDYIRDRLFAEDVKTISVGSPFDYKSSTLIYIPEDIPEPNKPGYQKAVERGIIELAAALNGRVMALFTSYAQLRETAPNIAPRLALGGITVYDQATGGNRETLLDNFKSAEKAVLLGTRSFWEGVDIPGADLSALIIIRLPFAVPNDPIFSARSDTFQNGFQQYAIPDAILRFRQGFGRLIRTRSDRGIVTIFDSRIVNKGYGVSFLESLPDCTLKYGAMSELAPSAKSWLKLPEE